MCITRRQMRSILGVCEQVGDRRDVQNLPIRTIFHIFFEKKFGVLKILRTFALAIQQWWIHLRARIPASHAGHRGSNPYPLQKNEARRCRKNSTSFVFDNTPTNLFVRRSSQSPIHHKRRSANCVPSVFIYFCQKIYLIWITFYNFVRLLHKR